MNKRKLSRRDFLHLSAGAAAGSLLAACVPAEQQVVEKVVTVEVEKEVVKEVEKEVEKVVTATPPPAEAVTIRFIATAPPEYYNMDAFSESDPLIDVEYEDIGDSSFEEVLLTSVAGGDPPELAWSGGGNRIWRWAQMGALMDIAPLVEGAPHPELDEIDPGAIAEYNSPDFFPPGQVKMAPGQYGWPVYNTIWHMIYNKRILDEAGIDYPQRGWSWDDFRATLQQVSDPDSGVWSFVMPAGGGNVDFVNFSHNLLWTNDGNLYDSEGKAALTSPEALEAYQFLQDLVLEDKTTIMSGTTEGVDYMGGNVAFQFWGNWIIGWYDSAVEDPYGVVPVPMQKDEAILGGIDGFVFPAGSANPEAGWEVAKWLSSYEGQKVLNDADVAEVISVNKLAAAEAYDNPNFGVPEEAQDWIPSAAFTITRFNPWIPVGPGFDYPTAFEGIFLGDSVEDTLAQVAADVDALNESTPSYG